MISEVNPPVPRTSPNGKNTVSKREKGLSCPLSISFMRNPSLCKFAGRKMYALIIQKKRCGSVSVNRKRTLNVQPHQIFTSAGTGTDGRRIGVVALNKQPRGTESSPVSAETDGPCSYLEKRGCRMGITALQHLHRIGCNDWALSVGRSKSDPLGRTHKIEKVREWTKTSLLFGFPLKGLEKGARDQ